MYKFIIYIILQHNNYICNPKHCQYVKFLIHKLPYYFIFVKTFTTMLFNCHNVTILLLLLFLYMQSSRHNPLFTGFMRIYLHNCATLNREDSIGSLV